MTNETKNELAQVEENVQAVIVTESDEYVVVKENGKFARKAKFKDFSSVKAESREDKIWLMGLMEGDEETGNGLKEHVGKQIVVSDIITRRYDKINEETGATEYGVLTYLITKDKIAYVTSSKTVYFSIQNIMKLFGTPDSPEWVDITLLVGKKKGQNGDMITIKMIG